jgi:hypothetical protein
MVCVGFARAGVVCTTADYRRADRSPLRVSGSSPCLETACTNPEQTALREQGWSFRTHSGPSEVASHGSQEREPTQVDSPGLPATP